MAVTREGGRAVARTERTEISSPPILNCEATDPLKKGVWSEDEQWNERPLTHKSREKEIS